MSYTPEQLEEFLTAIEKFRQVMWARIRANDPGFWREHHVMMCQKTIDQLNDLEVDLRERF